MKEKTNCRRKEEKKKEKEKQSERRMKKKKGRKEERERERKKERKKGEKMQNGSSRRNLAGKEGAGFSEQAGPATALTPHWKPNPLGPLGSKSLK